ncbi:hypothetical protein [Kribbella kalugense]|nr:hypothetical protein [Kribbella kalugense]
MSMISLQKGRSLPPGGGPAAGWWVSRASGCGNGCGCANGTGSGTARGA